MERKAFKTIQMLFQKSENLNFSKGVSPRFCLKIRIFFILCFFEKKSMEISFVDILDRKKGFLDCKNAFLKK